MSLFLLQVRNCLPPSPRFLLRPRSVSPLEIMSRNQVDGRTIRRSVNQRCDGAEARPCNESVLIDKR